MRTTRAPLSPCLPSSILPGYFALYILFLLSFLRLSRRFCACRPAALPAFSRLSALSRLPALARLPSFPAILPSPFPALPPGFPRKNPRLPNPPHPPFRRSAPAPPFAPKRLFKPFRCYGRLIFRKEFTVLFAPKRSTSRFAALTLRVTSHRPSSSSCAGVPHGLFEQESSLCSLVQNTHAPGSLRSPSGYGEPFRNPT